MEWTVCATFGGHLRWNTFECGEHGSGMYQRTEARELLAVSGKNLYQWLDSQVIDITAKRGIGDFALTIIARIIVEIGWCGLFGHDSFTTAHIFAASSD